MSFSAKIYRTSALVVAAMLLAACARQDQTASESAFFKASYWDGVIEVEGLS